MTFKVKKSGNWPFYTYELISPFQYLIRKDGYHYMRKLPKGWTFDGATFGWLIGLRKEASMEPAAIHDDMYECRGKMIVLSNYGEITVELNKEDADKRYLKSIGDDGVNVKSWQLFLVKLAFNTVGHIFWRT